MKKLTALSLIVALLTLSVFAAGFTDMSVHWSKTHVIRLADNNIINGYPDGRFKPNAPVTVAESVKLLVASMQYTRTDTSQPWYQPYLNTAVNKGIITGDSRALLTRPNAAITRLEFVTLVSNLLVAEDKVSQTVTPPSFDDVKATVALTRVYSLGIVGGYPDNTFRPNKTITRGEIATIIDRMYFGKRDAMNDLLTVPVFDTYHSRFDAINKTRLADLVAGRTPTATHAQASAEQLRMVSSAKALYDAYNADQATKALVDTRSQTDYDYAHIQDSVNRNLNSIIKHPSAEQLYLVVSSTLTQTEQEALLNAYKQVSVYTFSDDDLAADGPAYAVLVGTFKNTASVPDYLVKRFRAVSTAYGLTWSDAAFEAWWKASDEDEKSKYLFPIYKRNVPVIDFKTKTVKLSNSAASGKDGKTPKSPDDPAKYTLGIDDMEYISYEILKRNIDYFMHDGQDWGRIDVSYLDDMARKGVFVRVDDPTDEGSIFNHFRGNACGTFAFKANTHIAYWAEMQKDAQFILDGKPVKGHVTDYVTNNTKLNMQLLHGMEMGQQVYDNYIQGYIYSIMEDTRKLGQQFDTAIGGFMVKHIFANGYQILYKK